MGGLWYFFGIHLFMKKHTIITAQPSILRWARETVGMSVSDVAHALKRSEKDVEAWEAGLSSPTYSQLETLAYKVLKRPLAVFFLPSPPTEVTPRQEFRTLPDTDLETLPKDTLLHVRKAHAFQLTLRDVFGHTNPATSHIWKSFSLSLQASIQTQALKIRDCLGISLEEQISWEDPELALKKWRQAIESVGVFVFKAAFKQKEISGFCLRNDVFPLIYLNNSTSKTRQSFSLMHELAHILLAVNGISKTDASYIDRLPQQTKKIEQFCNAIAAEILIPDIDFQVQAARLPNNLELSTDTFFSNLSSRYSVRR